MRSQPVLLGLAAARLTLVIAAAVLAGGSARADEAPISASDIAVASGLKARGDAAMDELRFEDAIAAYTRAYGVGRDPVVLYNLGRAFHVTGRLAEALDHLERFDALAAATVKARAPGLASLLAELREKLATLKLTCPVAGARVLVRGVDVGTTPLAAPLRILKGSARIEVTSPGHAPYVRDVVLAGRAILEIDVALVPTERGVLVIRTEPEGASVTIDDAPPREAPAEATLTPGEHRISVRAAGRAPVDTTVVVRGGERRELTVTLKAPASVLKTWWFWTGVGVVVAAGAATVVVLAKPRDAGDGTIPPGQVAGPLVHTF